MALIRPTLSDPATYRRLVYLLLGLPLGVAWFVALVTVWSLSLGLIVTPLVIPLLIGLAAMTRGFGTIEAEIARALLDVDARAPADTPSRSGFWARFRAMFGPSFWRTQAFLLLRAFVGFPIAVALISLLGTALSLIFAPFWVPFVHGGAQLGFWHPHTFLGSIPLVPVGLVMLPATLLLVNPLTAVFRPMVSGLLPGPAALPGATGSRSHGRREPACHQTRQPGRPAPSARDPRRRRRSRRVPARAHLGADVARLLLADLGRAPARPGAGHPRLVGAHRRAPLARRPFPRQSRPG